MCYHQYSQQRHYAAWRPLHASLTPRVPCLDLVPFRQCCLLKSLLQSLYLGARNCFQGWGTFVLWGGLLIGPFVLPCCCCGLNRTSWGVISGEIQLQLNWVVLRKRSAWELQTPEQLSALSWFSLPPHVPTCLHAVSTVQGAALPETYVLVVGIKLDCYIIVTDKCLVESIFQSENFIGIWIVEGRSLLQIR